MTAWQLALAALADFARNKSQDDIAEYLELIGTIYSATRDDKEKFAALTAEIQGMVTEGRDPSEQERQSVRDRRKELVDAIAALPGDGGG